MSRHYKTGHQERYLEFWQYPGLVRLETLLIKGIFCQFEKGD
jgi:hypothetical protein